MLNVFTVFEPRPVSHAILGAAIKVHRVLGPGLLESAYKTCLATELVSKGLFVECEKPLPLIYGGQHVGVGYRLDMIVERRVIVEVKAVDRLNAVHFAQLLSYLRLADCRVGLLLNFNVRRLSDKGVRRVLNGLPDD